MTRHITRIEDWNNVNWDEVDFDTFEADSLRSAPLDRLAQFRVRQAQFRQETGQHEIAAAAEAHFRQVLLEGRDPRSNRLFGEHFHAYQKLIVTHIPYQQVWDLAGIEVWSDDEWKEVFAYGNPRTYQLGIEQANWKLLMHKKHDHQLRGPIPSRFITKITNWNDVNWDNVDFDHYEYPPGLDDMLPPYPRDLLELISEKSNYEVLYKPLEESRRQWDHIDFSTYDWDTLPPPIFSGATYLSPYCSGHGSADMYNINRAEQGKRIWEENKAKARREAETAKTKDTLPVTEQVLRQAGITLPDEA